jgi:hypothetical protein
LTIGRFVGLRLTHIYTVLVESMFIIAIFVVALDVETIWESK